MPVLDNRWQIEYYRVAEVRRRFSCGCVSTMIPDTFGHMTSCSAFLGTALTGDIPTQALQEPRASCDAAFSCLLQLGVKGGAGLEVGGAHCSNVVDGDTLPISRLIDLAGELGFKAERARLDWQGLQKAGFSHPILFLLNDTDVIVVTGGGRDGAAEVAVWDPADRYGKTLFVSREDFERASTGHAVIITPPPPNGAEAPPSLNFCWYTSAGLELLRKTSAKGQNLNLPPPLKDHGVRPKPGLSVVPQQSGRATARETRGSRPLAPAAADVGRPPSSALSRAAATRRVFPLFRFWLVAAGLVLAAGIGVILQRSPASDPVAGAIGVITEFSEVVLSKALSISEAAVRDMASRIEGDPRTEPVPLLAAPTAAPASQPSRAAPTAAPVSEPSPTAPPDASASVPPPTAPIAAPASVPPPTAPTAAPAREPPPTAPIAAPASEPPPTAPVAAPASEPPPTAPIAAPASEPPPTAPTAAPVGEPSPIAPPDASASVPPPTAPTAASASEPPPTAPIAAPASAPPPTAPTAAPAGEPSLTAPAAAPAQPFLAARSAATVTTATSKVETTARPEAPGDLRLSAEEIAALLARGDRVLSSGDVTSARLFFERAANAGAGLAAVRLGQTFDPVFLERARLRGVRADLGAALSWYRRARDLGAAEAEAALRALEGK